MTVTRPLRAGAAFAARSPLPALHLFLLAATAADEQQHHLALRLVELRVDAQMRTTLFVFAGSASRKFNASSVSVLVLLL